MIKWVGKRNGKDGPCANCMQLVLRDQGLLCIDESRGRWLVFHLSCAPQEIQAMVAARTTAAATPPALVLDVRDGRSGAEVVIRQTGGRMSNDMFERYRGAVRECCRNEKQPDGSWAAVAPLEQGGEIQAQLEQAGFRVEVTPTLMERLAAKIQVIQTVTAMAAERAAQVDAILRARGLYLYPFQSTGVQWLAPRNKALLADAMGLGKTVQACTAFPDNAPVVVVCPAVVKTNWQDELARWRPERAPAVILEGRGTFTRWPQAGETFILNFAILPEDLAALGPPAQGTYLIADEAQNLKSLKLNMDGTVNEKKSSQQAGRFFNMRTAVFATLGAVWLLTGTPIMNRAEELWSVLQQADLARDAFGSFKNYMVAWNATPGRYGGVDWGYPNEEIVGDRLQRVMLRREKTEVLADLPPKSYQTIVVPIDAASRAELEQYSDEIMGALHAGDPNFDPAEELERIHAQDRQAELEQSEGASEKLTEREKLLLAGSESTSFEKLSKAREALARAKLPALLALVDQHEAAEPNEPLIVFSAHLEPLRALARRPGWAILDGSVSAKKRGQIVRAFQAGQLRGLAASIKASGVGITLTRANKAVFLDRDWTPSNNLQAEDRIYRIGQFRPTTIVTLIAEHPVDELITSNLTWKERIIRGSIMAGKRGPTEIVLEPVRMVHEAAPLSAPAPFDPAAAGFALGPLDPNKVREEYLRRLRQEEIEEEIRVRQGRKQTREERAQARLKPTEEQIAKPDRRQARTPLEEWAAYGIVHLTGLDSDRAFEENYMGWSKATTTPGHQFAALILGYGGLTDDEWQDAVSLVMPYQGQVGPPPGVDPDTVRKRKRTVKKLAGDVFTPGERVMTPDGPGAVVEKYARTYAVRLDSGALWKGGAAKLLRDGPAASAEPMAPPPLTQADLADLTAAMGAPPPGPAPEYNPMRTSRGTATPPWYHW